MPSTPVERFRSVLYKEAEIEGSQQNLQSLLDTALQRRASAQERILTIGDEGAEVCRLINNFTTRVDCLVVEFLQFEPGVDPMTLNVASGDTTLPVSQLEHDDDTEVVDGYLYLAVRENHAAVIQSTTLRHKRFEEYLGWLLSEGTAVGGDGGVSILLADRCAPSIEEHAQRRTVKEVTFGQGLNTTVKSQKNSEAGEVQSDAEYLEGASAIGFLEKVGAIFGFGAKAQKALRENAEPQNIRVKLTVGYVRGTNNDGAEVLKAFANVARDEETPGGKVVFDDDTEIRGDELRTKGKISVETTARLPVWESVAEQLPKWLRETISSRLG